MIYNALIVVFAVNMMMIKMTEKYRYNSHRAEIEVNINTCFMDICFNDEYRHTKSRVSGKNILSTLFSLKPLPNALRKKQRDSSFI